MALWEPLLLIIAEIFCMEIFVQYLNLALFTTMANEEDHPTYTEALYGPDSCGFISAMDTEILTSIELNVFDMVERELDMNVILIKYYRETARVY